MSSFCFKYRCVNYGRCYPNWKCVNVGRWFTCNHYQCYMTETDRPCCVICRNTERNTYKRTCVVCSEHIFKDIRDQLCVCCRIDELDYYKQELLRELRELLETIDY